ncbi:MAG: tetraacyldisaccharide 4'-kinase [Bacteroidaceae bacterium]|nr:tetraacyldisaccharide 4'-kinase [Bacteroidaceae bacterium]
MSNKTNKTILHILNAINPFYWITRIRNHAFDKGHIKETNFDLPVICIGNITVGGTGKTPHTEYLIRLLKEKENVAVLSRGYGRKTKGFIKASNSSNMQEIGDEPFQIKSKFSEITVAVDEKRVEGIEILLKECQPSVILLDDAYQHRHVKAGMNILLIDCNRPIWNDCQLPFGRLREDANGSLRADIIIITKCPLQMSREQQDDCKNALKTKKGVPIFFSTMRYGKIYPLFPNYCKKTSNTIKEKNVLLLTGIAKPAPLKAELMSNGAEVTLKQYADHHNFSKKELEEVSSTFDALKGEKIIVTTEKDASRLTGRNDIPQNILENIYALPIEVVFLNDEQKMFNQIILDYVTKNSGDSRVLKS